MNWIGDHSLDILRRAWSALLVSPLLRAIVVRFGVLNAIGMLRPNPSFADELSGTNGALSILRGDGTVAEVGA